MVTFSLSCYCVSSSTIENLQWIVTFLKEIRRFTGQDTSVRELQLFRQGHLSFAWMFWVKSHVIKSNVARVIQVTSSTGELQSTRCWGQKASDMGELHVDNSWNCCNWSNFYFEDLSRCTCSCFHSVLLCLPLQEGGARILQGIKHSVFFYLY